MHLKAGFGFDQSAGAAGAVQLVLQKRNSIMYSPIQQIGFAAIVGYQSDAFPGRQFFY
jgi:hypothetical protein